MNNKFSENLKKIRKEHNLSQEQLADELGVSRQAISKWESAIAYPEMDKIIALCNKFNLNIDDLLHKDIKEVKGEEESKKKINDYIDECLSFFTNTINLFSSMNLKSKIKCIFEQCIIAVVLFLISLIIKSVLGNFFESILRILPVSINHFFSEILYSVIAIFCFVAAILIMVHIFKTRYLDYYDKLKKEEDSNEEEIVTENNKNDIEDKKVKKDKISLSKKDNKIIIRDPKHSEYRFINLLFKMLVGFIKFIMLCFVLSLTFVLMGIFCSFVVSFLIYKTGLFFLGLVAMILSSGVITVIFMLLMLNFVFNRKSNKKAIIWSFILSIIIFGVGCGLVFNASLNFEVMDNNEDMLDVVTKEHDMNNNLIINPYSKHKLNYVPSNINNIKIEYTLNKYCTLHEDTDEDNIIDTWVSCERVTKLAKVFLKNLNKKKIVPITGSIDKITVYASKENIEKLKNNQDNYLKNIEKEENEEINSYQERINELENENNELKEKIDDLEKELDD